MYVECMMQVDSYKTNALPNDAVPSNDNEHYIYVEIEEITKKIPVKIDVRDLGFPGVKPLKEIPVNAKAVTK